MLILRQNGNCPNPCAQVLLSTVGVSYTRVSPWTSTSLAVSIGTHTQSLSANSKVSPQEQDLVVVKVSAGLSSCAQVKLWLIFSLPCHYSPWSLPGVCGWRPWVLIPRGLVVTGCHSLWAAPRLGKSCRREDFNLQSCWDARRGCWTRILATPQRAPSPSQPLTVLIGKEILLRAQGRRSQKVEAPWPLIFSNPFLCTHSCMQAQLPHFLLGYPLSFLFPLSPSFSNIWLRNL